MASRAAVRVRAFAVTTGVLSLGSMALGQTTVPSSPPEPQVVFVRPMPPEPAPPLEPRTSFSFSVGWARLNASGGDSPVDGADGWYLDTEFSYKLKPDKPLWLGISFNGSYYDESEDKRLDTVIPSEVELDASLSTFCIEPRLTYVLLPRRDKGIYLAGKLGAGLLIADYWATSVVERPGGFFIDSDGDTTFAFLVRPGAQFGYSGGKWMVGAEVSEMWAWGDFNALGDELNELRAGFFFTFNY